LKECLAKREDISNQLKSKKNKKEFKLMLKEMKKRQRFSKIQVMSSYSLLNQIAQK
jgi:hypothetical protein